MARVVFSPRVLERAGLVYPSMRHMPCVAMCAGALELCIHVDILELIECGHGYGACVSPE